MQPSASPIGGRPSHYLLPLGAAFTATARGEGGARASCPATGTCDLRLTLPAPDSRCQELADTGGWGGGGGGAHHKEDGRRSFHSALRENQAKEVLSVTRPCAVLNILLLNAASCSPRGMICYEFPIRHSFHVIFINVHCGPDWSLSCYFLESSPLQ